ncbi:hypothetical protein PARMER_00342 [Parabacteroides merdae ATCC 43184]|nr:hypothetical protein PARMER_00342 [Parabacteroides merdae ATCC 43184]
MIRAFPKPPPKRAFVWYKPGYFPHFLAYNPGNYFNIFTGSL